MEVVTRAVHPNSICEGCLTRDRILAIITNDEIKEVYCTIIHEKLHAPGPLVLCWECIANIQRYISFRRQCSQARETLIQYMLNPASITSLSRLKIVNNIEINITHAEETINGVNVTPSQGAQNWSQESQHIYEQRELKVKNHGVKNTPIGISGVFCSHDESVKSENSVLEQLSSEKETADITFIKVEDDSVIDDDGWVDDEFDHQECDGDDKEIAVVIRTDDEKSKVKTKKAKRKKSKLDFDDSDEEPLKNKKRNKTVRQKKQKRKKDEEAPKGDKLKLGKKREKPPGVVSNPRVNKKLQQLNVGQGQLEMVVLSWEEVEEERQKALSSIVFTRHEYRCADCIVGFNHKFKLDNHMKKHDPSAGDMICNVCQVRCRDSHALCAHRRRHRVRWRCCLCGETSSRAAVAADHVSRAHGAAAPTHTCSVCGHAEPTLGKLRNHIKNHAERQKCELCGKTFRDRTSLRTHLFIHKGEKEYACPRCDKRFLFKKAMEVHLVTHDAPAHLYCYQCDMNFKNRMSYTQHMKYSLKHIDPAKLKYACQLCDKKFVKATRLEEHNLAVHLKATPISCTVHGCNFACSSRPVLRTHIRMVHRNARAQRNHVCDACGKTYTTKKTLEGHMRSHTGERPFKCALCPSTFGYEAALYNHNKLVHLKPKMCRRPPQPPLTLQIPGPTPELT